MLRAMLVLSAPVLSRIAAVLRPLALSIRHIVCYKETMSITEKAKWGSRSMATWLLFIVSIFIIIYLIWIFFQSRAETGEACMNNQDCKSKICYSEDSRHTKYCTQRCSGDADCPEGWRCLKPPHMPQGMYICLRR
jgi:hypothetical protein